LRGRIDPRETLILVVGCSIHSINYNTTKYSDSSGSLLGVYIVIMDREKLVAPPNRSLSLPLSLRLARINFQTFATAAKGNEP
jgi:hypothetical protein